MPEEYYITEEEQEEYEQWQLENVGGYDD